MRLFVGTYSDTIATLHFDPATGRLERGPAIAGIGNASWLERHPSLPMLYAANELRDGAVTAYAIVPDGLVARATHPTLGADPCHLGIAGGLLVAANYSSGHVTAFPLDAQGVPGPACQVIAHTGASLHPTRQSAAHPHHVGGHAGRLLVSDLGLDAVMVYRVAEGALVADGPAISTPQGGGPRRFIGHPTLPVAYVLNELHASITRYRTGAPGGWRACDTVTMLPAGWIGGRSGAELAVAASGRFLYASNRGHDSIAIFALDDEGALHPRGHAESGGASPRHIEISPCGTFLAVANQRSDRVTMFRLDPSTGHPEEIAHAAVERPVCVRFIA